MVGGAAPWRPMAADAWAEQRDTRARMRAAVRGLQATVPRDAYVVGRLYLDDVDSEAVAREIECHVSFVNQRRRAAHVTLRPAVTARGLNPVVVRLRATARQAGAPRTVRARGDAVTRYVNDPRHDDPAAIEPAPAPGV